MNPVHLNVAVPFEAQPPPMRALEQTTPIASNLVAVPHAFKGRAASYPSKKPMSACLLLGFGKKRNARRLKKTPPPSPLVLDRNTRAARVEHRVLHVQADLEVLHLKSRAPQACHAVNQLLDTTRQAIHFRCLEAPARNLSSSHACDLPQRSNPVSNWPFASQIPPKNPPFPSPTSAERLIPCGGDRGDGRARAKEEVS